MLEMQMIRNKDTKFINILMIYVLLNPVFDLLTSLMKQLWGIEISISILVRGGFLLFIILYMVLKKRYHPKLKIITLIYILAVAIYLIVFIINMYVYKGLIGVVGEIKSVIKTFYFPIIIVGIINCAWEEREKINLNWLSINGLLYSGVMLIAQITGTQFSSYTFDKVGHTGWFFASNETGAIMGILFPLVVWTILESEKIYLFVKIIVLGLYIYTMYQIGTKVPALAVIGTLGLVSLVYLIRNFLSKTNSSLVKKFIISSVLAVYAIGLIFISPVGVNLNIHSKWFQDNIPRIVGSYNDKKPGMMESENYKEINIKLTEKQARALSFIFSSRDRYVIYKIQESMNSPMSQKVLGMGFGEKMKDGSYSNEIVEIDYFDILFAYGVVGTVLYWIYVTGVVLYGVYVLIINKGFRKDRIYIYGVLSILLSLGIAFFAGHVFIAPAVSVYPAVIIVFFLYMVCEKDKYLLKK